MDLQASDTVPNPQIGNITPANVSAGKPDLSKSLQEGHHQGKLDGVYTDRACALQSES